jgi:anhydro-N-acetylmuramic acid kinase
MRVAGLISGTSMDGIDVAVGDFHLDGDTIGLTPLGARSVPYPAGLRAALEAVLPPRAASAEELCRLDTLVGQEFAAAAVAASREIADGIELVVSHGQTVFHWVDDDGRARGGLQLGQPAWIAEATGLPVVADLRARDIAAGGQGAPLASTLDTLLLAGSAQPTAALNLGGIANITVVAPGRPPVAFDTGPANALIDAAVSHLTGGTETHDEGGVRAARGSVSGELLERLLDEPYYRRPPPKSTGKELFHLDYLLARLGAAGEIAADDLVATATELTARTVAAACADLAVRRVVASGGGVENPALMARLAAALGAAELVTIDAYGIPSAAKEAYLFALLGFLSIHGLAGNVPSATGAARPVVLGCLVPGSTGVPVVAAGQAPARLVVVDR